MATIHFASSIQRHVSVPSADHAGACVAEVLAAVFTEHAGLRSYVLDDQGVVRQHIAIFVDGNRLEDIERQSDPVGAQSEIHVIQALSGG